MWRAIIIWLRNFFGFSRSEANGFVLLLFILIIILFAPIVSKQILIGRNPDLFLQSDAPKLDSLLAVMDNSVVDVKKERSSPEKIELTNFDLNSISPEKLESFGLPAFIAERIVKYREKVKPFEQAEDLLKIYGIDSADYLRLLPYINIKAVAQKRTYKENAASDPDFKFTKDSTSGGKRPFENYKYKLQAFDINQADTARLKKVYGIGAVYAQRIVDYRSLLGGFTDMQQLGEVYGLKSPNLDSLKKFTFVGPDPDVNRLEINSISEEELAKHPYVSYKQAKLIIAYREMHGNYREAGDLLKIKVLDTAFIEKVEKYLSFKAQ